jgi:prevent-host-death family protein
LESFAIRDLREHTGELVRNAENAQYSVVSKHGKPLFVALPFDEAMLKAGVSVALADKLVRSGSFQSRLVPSLVRSRLLFVGQSHC